MSFDSFDFDYTNSLRQQQEEERQYEAAQRQFEDARVAEELAALDGQAEAPSAETPPPGFDRLTGDLNQQEVGFLGTIADIGKQIVGGARDAGVELTQTALDLGGLVDSGVDVDQFTADLGLDVADPTTAAGGFARGTAQFLTGFVPALGALRALKATSTITKFLNAAGTARAGLASDFALYTAAGAVSDFAVFDPQAERLSNLAKEFGFDNPVTDYLAADPEDGEFQGRLKNVLEGAALGALTDGIIEGLKFGARWGKTHRALLTEPGANPKVLADVRAAGAKVTYMRQELADARRARAAWADVGGMPGDAVVLEARRGLRGGQTGPEAAAMIETAKVRAGQSGRSVAEEFDALARPLDEAARAGSARGQLEAAGATDLSNAIGRTQESLADLDARIAQSRLDLEVAEEEFYDAVTSDEWRALYDDVRHPAEAEVDSYVPAEVADDVAEIREYLDTTNCNL